MHMKERQKKVVIFSQVKGTSFRNMASDAILAGAAKSASYNIVLQLFFRLLTFGLNAVVLRYISKDLLGVVNVRLTLLNTTICFMAREAFRRACLSKPTGERQWTQVVNLLWCVFPISILYAAVFGYLWGFMLEQPDAVVVPYYKLGVVCFAMSSIIECLAEPLWVVGQISLYVRLRVLIDSVSLTLRCVLTVCLVVLYPNLGLLAFSAVQIIYAISYSGLQYSIFAYLVASHKISADFPLKKLRDFFPRIERGKPLIDINLASLVWSFFKQSFLKQILTEGERYVMTVFDILSFGDQGVYDVINNLGSLVARFIFLPMEDSAYLFFSQSVTRGVCAADQKKDVMPLVSKVFETLLKVVTMIGLTALVYGYAYSYLLLDIYGGTLLSEGTGPRLLQAYCGYVLLLAVNGITECFTFATMSKEEVDRYNKKLLLFSLLFLTSSWFLTKQLGNVGFVYTNCLNMLARILHSMYYTKQFYRKSSLSPMTGILPSAPVLASFLGALLVTILSEGLLCCDRGWPRRILHIAIGGACLLVNLGAIYVSEKDTIIFIKDQYKQKHSVITEKKES